MSGDHIVCIHAFISDDAGDTYCDTKTQTPDGWSVYVRTEMADLSQPFDIVEVYDFVAPNPDVAYESARLIAASLAIKYDAEIEEY